jgi:tRNA wybutosine-synthesizing protein 1
MIPEKVRKVLEKQHYEIIRKHSAVQVCRWTKKSLRNEGVCYKEKFYGIKSHLCCQMTPAVMWCPNKCVHCWRAIEMTLGEELGKDVDSPSKIIDGCIKAQRKLLQGFKKLPNAPKKQLSKADQEKWLEAQEPTQFAISLSGEPTIYKYLGELIEELKKRGKTSFLVTNGLYPKKIKELERKKQLPTQLYISVNTSNKEEYQKFHRSCKNDAWDKLMKSLDIMSKLKSRTVFRMNLVRNLNMNDKHVKEYAKLINKANPMFVEVKGFMSVGFARERLDYDRMPTHEEIKEFSKKLVKGLDNGMKILDEHYFSRVVVLGKKKSNLKI